MQNAERCGYIAIVGRPNVGKSTLLNHILGQKLSITSRKPQTTRHQILGIKTVDNIQAIFVDTPGIHKNAESEKAINRYMNRAATTAMRDVDAIVFVLDQQQWTDADEQVLLQVKNAKCPVFLVINKVDRINDKNALLPYIEELNKKMDFKEIIPLSALQGKNLERLEQCIYETLPESPMMFDEDQITDRSSRFLAAEIVREKIMRQLGEELPYATTVEIEDFKDSGKSLHIHALILVEREGQKRIVIGDKGSRLRNIGIDARKDMETLFENKVMLKLWVKVKSGWSDSDRAIKSLGYDFD